MMAALMHGLNFLRAIRRQPVVAGMATMLSRKDTAPAAIASILPQVDRLWLYLDRFDDVPDFAHQSKIRVLRSQDCGLHFEDGKFLGAPRENGSCVYICCDDDIIYPPDYASRMARELSRSRAAAMVGVHGVALASTVGSYFEDRQVFHFAHELPDSQSVDILGTGTIAFNPHIVRFDPRAWTVKNCGDLVLAIEMKRRNIPMIAIARGRDWLRPLAENQPDSLYAKLMEEKTLVSELARLLVSLPSVGETAINKICGPI